MKSFRDIRVIPVVLVAIFGFAVLKVAGLVIDGGYVFDYQPQSTKQSWAQETLNFPAGTTRPSADITGSVDEKPKEGGAAKPEVAAAGSGQARRQPWSIPRRASRFAVGARDPGAAAIAAAGTGSAGARNRYSRKPAQGRRKARRIAASRRLKAIESRIATATEQKTEADAARFKGIITMYESMKPKDAAKVFDRLEMPVLFEIASQIAPRKMSDILGLMSTDAAERLTTEMARRAGPDKSASAAELPKIEGKMLPQKPN